MNAGKAANKQARKGRWYKPISNRCVAAAKAGTTIPSRYQRRGLFPRELIRIPATAPVIVSAMTSDNTTANCTLIAIEPTNSPAGPGINEVGAKASTVVKVDPVSGIASRRVVSETALLADMPFATRPRISSQTTMALSINNPKAMINPVMDIWCSGTPYNWSAAKTPREHSGNVSATTTADRQPISNHETRVTAKAPAAKLNPKLASRCST